jgi:hypothetical protein
MNEIHTGQLNTSLGWAFLRLGDLSADKGRLLSEHGYIKTKDQLALFLDFAMIRPHGCSWGSVMKKYRLDGYLRTSPRSFDHLVQPYWIEELF